MENNAASLQIIAVLECNSAYLKVHGTEKLLIA